MLLLEVQLSGPLHTVGAIGTYLYAYVVQPAEGDCYDGEQAATATGANG